MYTIKALKFPGLTLRETLSGALHPLFIDPLFEDLPTGQGKCVFDSNICLFATSRFTNPDPPFFYVSFLLTYFIAADDCVQQAGMKLTESRIVLL